MSNLNPLEIKKYYKNLTPPTKEQLEELLKKGSHFIDETFPPNKNSLTSRDKDGNFTDPVRGPEQLQFMEDDDEGSSERLTWKRPIEFAPNEKWDVFQDKIEFDDVQQGSLD